MRETLAAQARPLFERLAEPSWADALFAVAVTALAQFELRGAGATVGHGLAVLAQTLPIAWRRTAALTAVLVSAAALATEGLLLTPTNSLGALIAGLVLTYSAARHVPMRRLPVAGLAIAGGVAVNRAATPGSGLVDVLFDAFFVGTAWAVGRVLRRRQEQADRLRGERDDLIETTNQRTAAAIAAERSRMARELHDIVAHGLSIITVQAGAAEQIVASDPDRARQAIGAIREVSQQSMVDMRQLVGLMRTGPYQDDEQAPEPQPRLAHVDALVEQLRDAGLPVAIERTGHVRPLPHGLELCAFRVIQEALTNVVKHAGMVPTTVSIVYDLERLDITVTDRGAAADARREPGHGLLGMRERVSVFGGELEAEPAPGGGFRVAAHLPCPSHVPADPMPPSRPRP